MTLWAQEDADSMFEERAKLIKTNEALRRGIEQFRTTVAALENDARGRTNHIIRLTEKLRRQNVKINTLEELTEDLLAALPDPEILRDWADQLVYGLSLTGATAFQSQLRLWADRAEEAAKKARG